MAGPIVPFTVRFRRGQQGVVATYTLEALANKGIRETFRQGGNAADLVRNFPGAAAALTSALACFTIMKLKEPELRADLLDEHGAAVMADAVEFGAMEAHIRAAWGI